MRAVEATAHRAPAAPAALVAPALPAASRQITGQALQLIATRMRVHAHNVNNVDTVGFKKQRVLAAELPYDSVVAPGLRLDASGTASPLGLQLGSGAHAAGVIRDDSPGVLQRSHRNLDLAIEGNGFFQVLLPDGSTGYTRDGQLMVNADGKLVTSFGHVLQPEVTLAPSVTEVSVDHEGRVVVSTQGNPTPTQIASMQLAKFINATGLSAAGNAVLLETAASGSPLVGNPGSNGLGTLRQGFIERSNVELVEEMLLLREAQRQYDQLWALLQGSGTGPAYPRKTRALGAIESVAR